MLMTGPPLACWSGRYPALPPQIEALRLKREPKDHSVTCLEQEDGEGNVEYKYRIKDPHPVRLQQLVGRGSGVHLLALRGPPLPTTTPPPRGRGAAQQPDFVFAHPPCCRRLLCVPTPPGRSRS